MTPRRARTDIVRQYVITGGRAAPSRNAPVLDMVTLVVAPGDRPVTGFGPELTSIVELCAGGYLSIAEVASRTQLPMIVTKVLVADLIDTGHLVARRPPPKATLPPGDLMEKVLHGLERL
ncbi:DUF742 domain-containing protein [Streptomyces sp. NPDC059743]|uniref:DUF742 domain-containing protein n=1 Tax=Streptomyces sp. NPDC059743 TaxID=3346928 RepID=UPI00364F22C4